MKKVVLSLFLLLVSCVISIITLLLTVFNSIELQPLMAFLCFAIVISAIYFVIGYIEINK